MEYLSHFFWSAYLNLGQFEEGNNDKIYLGVLDVCCYKESIGNVSIGYNCTKALLLLQCKGSNSTLLK